MNLNSIGLVIFDLGNVVFEVKSQNVFRHWAQVTSLPEEFFAEHHIPDSIFHQFERGEITSYEFYEALIAYKKVDLSFEDFAEGWNAIYGKVYPEAREALGKLSDRVLLAALTNTNELHCKVWPDKYAGILRYFDRIFISSKLGFRKPEERAFEYVLKDCRMNPQETLFFDDDIENINKAKELGIQGIHVSEPSDITSELDKRRLIGRLI